MKYKLTAWEVIDDKLVPHQIDLEHDEVEKTDLPSLYELALKQLSAQLADENKVRLERNVVLWVPNTYGFYEPIYPPLK